MTLEFSLSCRNGERLHAEVEGDLDRPLVLYLHGHGSRLDGEKGELFRGLVRAAGWTFAAFDFRGHGRSGGALRDLTLSRALEDVGRVTRELERRGARRPLLLGSSMGGLVGLWHAALRPGAAAAGAFVAPAIGLAEDLVDRLGEEAMRDWRRLGVLEVTNELGTWPLGWGLVEDLERYPTALLAARLATPSLLFQGRRDDRVSWRRVADFAAASAAAELHLFDDGDHRLLARVAEIWTLIGSFLGRRDWPAAASCNP